MKTECPATLETKKYHTDLGVLFRSKTELDFYHFFIIEIDGKVGHRTWRKDVREHQRDTEFYGEFTYKYGIITIRIPLEKIVGSDKIENNEDLFNRYIWNNFDIRQTFFTNYKDQESERTKLLTIINRKFAIELAENNKSTKCENRDCKHQSYDHDLGGCNYRFTDNPKLRCNCEKPIFRSDS